MAAGVRATLPGLVGADTDVGIVERVLLAAADEGVVSAARDFSDRGAGAPDRVLDLVSGHAAGRVLYTLQRVGALDRFAAPSWAAPVARELGIDATWPETVMQFPRRPGGRPATARRRPVRNRPQRAGPTAAEL